MKKKIFFISIPLVLILMFVSFTKSSNEKSKYPSAGIGMANPAAVYCHELGYEYKIVDTFEGEKGICIFPDKSECEEWQFLTGKCGQEYSYCARLGYDQIIKTDGNNPFSKEYAVCVRNKKEIGSVTELFSLSEKAIRGSVSTVERPSTPEGASTESLPSSFDWRNKDGQDWMTSVKNQGGCGSCWAFSAVGTVEAVNNIYWIDSNLDLDLSEQYLVSDCSSAGSCCGGWNDEALGYIKTKGISDEGCFPYVDGSGCSCTDYTCDSNCYYRTGDNCSDKICSNRCSDWEDRIETIETYGDVSGQSMIKTKLIDYGPLAVNMNMDGSFDGNNIYRCTSTTLTHAVIIAGYDDTGGYWIVKNSWGTDWPNAGAGGYFKVGYGECGIESTVFYASLEPGSEGGGGSCFGIWWMGKCFMLW